MNKSDAVRMIRIMASADGDCYVCARALFDQAILAWPDVDWRTVAKEIREDKSWGNSIADNLENAIEGKPLD